MRLRDVTDPVAAMYAGIAAEKAGDFLTGVRFLSRAVDGLREQLFGGAFLRIELVVAD